MGCQGKVPQHRMTEPGPPPPWHLWLRLGSAGLGVILGLLMFPVWSLHYGNLSAGLWALASSLPAAVVLHMHLTYRKGSLAQLYPVARLVILRAVGLAGVLVTLIVTVYYLVMSAGQSVHPISDSYIIAGVWSFMALKWSAGLAYFSHSYRTRLLKDRDYSVF